jgi:DAK2 domain fusion protein YloV
MNKMDAAQLAKAFLAGAKSLESQQEYINELNVFPVPDGDTGTNMTMTIMSAAREVAAIENPEMKTVCKAISSGSLRGARGNSGVILSQLFRGFTKVVKTEDEITVAILAEACEKGCETAYKAVMKPKEGTILTVARGAADKAMELADSTDDIVFFLEEVLKEAEDVLSKTPDMLPVLKQAGVVDSGGQGLVQVLKGALDYLSGKEVDLTVDGGEKKEGKAEAPKYAYSVSYRIALTSALEDKKKEEYTAFVEKIGGDVKLNITSESVTTSMLTNDPGFVLSKALAYGALFDMEIKNISGDVSNTAKETPVEAPVEAPAKDEPRKKMGFIAVSIGEGINSIFRELGADYIIEGGQTMNPSTDDILNAVSHVNADNIFILPNNKNIILAANQAVELCEDKHLVVIPTKTIPQGITALINYIPDETVEENKDRMVEEIANVKTGQVTYAVRDTVIDDKEITKGDYMGIGDAGILAVNKDITMAFIDMLKEMVDDESAIISVYYGQDATEEDAKNLVTEIEGNFPGIEVELQNGGQPVYYYVCSVE